MCAYKAILLTKMVSLGEVSHLNTNGSPFANCSRRSSMGEGSGQSICLGFWFQGGYEMLFNKCYFSTDTFNLSKNVTRCVPEWFSSSLLTESPRSSMAVFQTNKQTNKQKLHQCLFPSLAESVSTEPSC